MGQRRLKKYLSNNSHQKCPGLRRLQQTQAYIYLHTAQQLGLHPSRCVAFEDSGPGVLAAIRAGVLTFAVPNSFTKDHDFSQAAFIIDPSSEIDMEDFFKKINSRMS